MNRTLAAVLALLLTAFSLPAKTYRCKPCGHPCDSAVHTAPGTCDACHMPLVDAATITHATVAPADICSWIKSHPRALLLDVRTPGKFAGKAAPDFGTLKGAINIPVQDLKKRIGELNAFNNREILVYCSHSHRSSEASYALTQAGFKQITNLGGGMSEVQDSDCRR